MAARDEVVVIAAFLFLIYGFIVNFLEAQRTC